jgi:hypothetical protein
MPFEPWDTDKKWIDEEGRRDAGYAKAEPENYILHLRKQSLGMECSGDDPTISGA